MTGIVGIDGLWQSCAKCKCAMWMPMPLEQSARASEKISFYCPYGHSLHYSEGESETDRLRRERDQLKQRLAQKDDEIAYQRGAKEAAERSASAMRGQVTKIKNRVGNGVCPCCTRSFTNLKRHIATKHPDYNVVPFEAKAS